MGRGFFGGGRGVRGEQGDGVIYGERGRADFCTIINVNVKF